MEQDWLLPCIRSGSASICSLQGFQNSTSPKTQKCIRVQKESPKSSPLVWDTKVGCLKVRFFNSFFFCLTFSPKQYCQGTQLLRAAAICSLRKGTSDQKNSGLQSMCRFPLLFCLPQLTLLLQVQSWEIGSRERKLKPHFLAVLEDST